MAAPIVFISYRRSDASPVAGRLYDALSRRFGRDHVFMDVDTVRPGQDWVEAINGAIAGCDVLVALIGAGWAAATETGRRRIDEPTDRLRLELEAALRLRKTVIPVLVEQAPMPHEGDLPISLQPLARLQALPVRHLSFSGDLAALVRALRAVPVAAAAADAARDAAASPRPRTSARRATTVAAGEPITRGLLFADLRDYSGYAERHGDQAAAALLARYRTLVRTIVGRHAGAEVRTEGDSFYVLFPSASTAVAAGIEIVAEAGRENAEQPAAPIEVGVGIHAGETAETAEGPVGSAVNIAARICAQAKSGEVLVSDTVRGLTRTRQVGTFEPVGSRRLKGIAEPVQLYRVLAVGAPPTARGVADRARGVADRARGFDLRRVPLTAVVTIIVVLLAAPATLLLAAALGPKPTIEPSPATTATAGTVATVSAPPNGTPSTSAAQSPSAPVPQGTRIIFSRMDRPPGTPAEVETCEVFGSSKLYVADPADRAAEPYRMTEVGTDLLERGPAWSANDSTIVFAADDSVYAMTPAANAPAEVARSEVGSPVAGLPSITADGSRYAIAGLTFGWTLWVGPTDSLAPLAIYGDPTFEGEPSDPDSFDWFTAAAWLPDGDLVAITSTSPNQQELPSYRLERVSADGSGRQVLPADLADQFVGRHLAVSPDGTAAIFQTGLGSGARLRTVDLTTARIDAIGPDGSARAPAWSPDGKSLAYTDGINVFVLDVASGETEQVTNLSDAAACEVAWGDATADLVGPRPPVGPGVQPVERGVLAPGRYVFSKFQPSIELTVPGGWEASRNYVDGWELARTGLPSLPNDRPDIRTIDGARLQVGYEAACLSSGTIVLGDRPRDVIDWLESRVDLEMTPPGPVNVGGHTGLGTDITVKGEGCAEGVWASTLFLIGEDLYHMDAGDKTRILIIDVDGIPVTIFVSSTESVFDDYISEAQSVLDSITFPQP